jgi:HAD superfamily hydrolase (TIGR01509 family)
VAALEEAGALAGVDVSAAAHRAATMSAFERHGLDPELAEAVYALDSDLANHPLYPDVEPVLRGIRARDVAIAVVSDFHVDLRPAVALHGLGELVDAWVISFEHGIQKPDARMFLLAMQMLDVSPGAALMVGDQSATDGGAAAVGITTLILPPPPEHLEERGLEVVLRVLG